MSRSLGKSQARLYRRKRRIEELSKSYNFDFLNFENQVVRPEQTLDHELLTENNDNQEINISKNLKQHYVLMT